LQVLISVPQQRPATMFANILSLGPVYLTAYTFCFLVLFYTARRILKDNRIRRIGGVRAPVLSTNPLTGMNENLKSLAAYSIS
jgi:hypothetical protein